MRGLWLAAVLLSGCVLELDAEIACGDGHVDRRPEAGEECDPADEASYKFACSERGYEKPGACDPVTCQLDYDVCYPLCGNGIVEPERGEECDPAADLDAFVLEGGKPCVDLDNDGPLEFANGFSKKCLADCTWDRSDCNFCGDGRRHVVEPFPEECDDLDVPPALRTEFCAQCITDEIDPVPSAVKCQARCSDDCGGLEKPSDGLRCCLPSGETRSVQIPCCNPPAPGDPTICGPGFERPDD